MHVFYAYIYQGRIFIFLMGGVRKSLGGGVQLFASAWGVGLVGADRSKLERKKLCIILCPVYLRIVLNKLYSILTILHLISLQVRWSYVPAI